MNTKNIVITLALVVVVGAVAVFVLGNDDKIQTNPNKEISEHPRPDGVQLPDGSVKERPYEQLTFPENTLDTSDWETYRNDEFGFEVRHPKGWLVEFLDNKNNTPYGNAGDGFSESGYGGELRFFPDGTMSSNNFIFMRVSNVSLNGQIDALENNEQFSAAGIKKYIKVNNVVGVETKDFEGPGFYVYERYVLEGRDGITYEFGGLNEPNTDKYQAEIEQILLLFKLVE